MAGLAMFMAAANLRPAIAAVSPLVDRIRADLGLSATGAALLTTVPTLAMGLCAPLAATVARRFGLQRGVLLGLVVIAAATAARLIRGWGTCGQPLALRMILVDGRSEAARLRRCRGRAVRGVLGSGQAGALRSSISMARTPRASLSGP
ncbi:hypothetical protein [Actinomadura rupiterrae]|uniref:hypothetical protein n=1 Tax=Actinomadura rupiterrae TaxID=559627 RepID=UPI0020A50D1A|nr:hypothetical protein [Actinomadura rupiterrae]MCP2343188.1 MFS family permease [Actinomadura rupiterrae]